MDFKQIQELIKLVNKTDLVELTIEMENFKIKLKTKESIQTGTLSEQSRVSTMVPVQTSGFSHVPVAESQPIAQTPAPQNTGNEAGSKDKKEDAENANYLTIKSPMVGTFYRSSAPDKEPFVKVGDSIEKATVLCVIEAMKLFNEIESEMSGKIVKVLVEDSSPVEYDQPLFLVEPM